jgi:hypothetical protein
MLGLVMFLASSLAKAKQYYNGAKTLSIMTLSIIVLISTLSITIPA